LRRVKTIVAGSLKMWYRSKSTLFWTIAFPVLMILLFGSIFSISGNPKFDLYVQNLDTFNDQPTPLSEMFIDTLNDTGALNIVLIDTNANITQLVKEKDIRRLLTIPEGFQNQTIAGNSSLILKIVPAQVDTSSSAVKGIIESVAKGFTGVQEVIRLQEESITIQQYQYIDFFVPGVIGMTVLTTSIFGAISWNTKNRELGILKKLATTPLTKLEWIVGVIFHQIIMVFISTVIILVVGMSVFGLKVLPDIQAVILIASGSIAFSGIGMTISRFVKGAEAADAAGNAITFPMMFLSGTFFPKEMMPEFLRQIARILPLTYLNDGLRDSMIFGNSASALTNTAIMIAVGAFFIVLGSLITSWKEE